MSKVNFNELLEAYRTLWKNRSLPADENAETVIIEAITRELRDENSHPRVRKSLLDKYYLATKRIIESNLHADLKVALIKLHMELLELLKK